MQNRSPKTFSILLPVLPALLLALASEARGADWPTAFTYQGHLRSSQTNAHGLFDLRFALFDSPENGEPVVDPVLHPEVPVDHGRFTVTLDFGPAILSSSDLWLEIAVRPDVDPSGFFTLTPRQKLAPVPLSLLAMTSEQAVLAQQAARADHATHADHAVQADHADRADLAFTLPPGTVTAELVAPESLTTDRFAPGQVVTSVNELRDNVILVPGDNVSLATDGNVLTFSSTPAWHLEGNSGTDPSVQFLGTTDDQPLELRVHNAPALRLLPTLHPGIVNVLGGSGVNFIRPGVLGATIGGGGAHFADGPGYTNSIHSHWGTIAGGHGNLIGTNAAFSFIGGGGFHSVHSFAHDVTIAGGVSNRVDSDAFASVIAGGRVNRIAEYARASTISGGTENRIQANAFLSTISGGQTNSIGLNSPAATISGGGRNAILNNARFATISGGGDNFIHDDSFSSVIGGGGDNKVLSSSERSTIAGGKLNQIGASSPHATVSGGEFNQIGNLSPHAVIGGGFTNTIGNNAYAATIPGGYANHVAGPYAFASGRRAQALHPGAFVWADSTKFDFPSVASNEFAVRTTGGARFVTAVDFQGDPVSGVVLPAGGGSWESLSDRDAKENFVPVDPRQILDALVQLPIHSWNYKARPSHIRHLGPTAQDFQSAFALGSNPQRIATIDANGVALAAIQGLHQVVAERDSRIRDLEQRLDKLESILLRLGLEADLQP